MKNKLKLWAFGTWNDEEEFFDFAGNVIAENEELAEIEAKKEFPDDEIDVWEVKVKGFKIKCEIEEA